MKTRYLLLSLATALAANVAVAGARPASVQVTLSVDQPSTLPGLAVPLNLHVSNGPAAVHLGSSVRVRATSPDGQSFFAGWGEGVDTGELELGVTDEDTADFTLPANASVDLEIPALDLSRPSWALDPRMLALPGDWTLQVLVYSDDAAQPVATSNSAKLTIRMPSGGDVAIWQAIQRRELWAIADRTSTQNPQSDYFPYLAANIARRTNLEKIAIINHAIELHPSSPAVPSLRYALAASYGAEADRVWFQEHDLDKASALADQGRAQLTSMVNGRDTWGKLKAKVKLGDFPSRDYFLDLQRLQREKGNAKQ